MPGFATRVSGALLLLLAAGSIGRADPAASPSTPAPAGNPPAGAAPAAAPSAPANPAATPAAATPAAATAAASPDQSVAAAIQGAPVQVAQAPAAGDQTTPATPPAPAAPAAPAPAAAPAAPPAPSLVINGFVDVYYEYNFNRPPKFITNSAGMKVPIPGGIENNLRNFDFKSNEFALNMAELDFKHNVGPVGLTVNVFYGKAADFIHASEPGGSTYNNIKQAYLTAPLKFWNKDDTLDAGIFVTSAGNEVIQTKDNWNYTRSLLFAWAIPYYHAGLRYNHVINPTTGLSLQIVNGWNDVEDNNNSQTFGFSYNMNITKKLPWVFNYYGGPELPNDNHNWRHLADTTLTYNANDKTSFAANLDYAHESRDVGSVHWWGIAGYARHQLTTRTAVVLRGEYFNDAEGASTGTAQHVDEVTATYELKGPAGLLTRAEFRYDWSNRDVFINSSGGFKSNQPTLLIGSVYSF